MFIEASPVAEEWKANGMQAASLGEISQESDLSVSGLLSLEKGNKSQHLGILYWKYLALET